MSVGSKQWGVIRDQRTINSGQQTVGWAVNSGNVTEGSGQWAVGIGHGQKNSGQ